MPPNVLRVSCAAPIDRDNSRAEISFQNRYDLARRKAASATRACWAGPPWWAFTGNGTGAASRWLYRLQLHRACNSARLVGLVFDGCLVAQGLRIGRKAFLFLIEQIPHVGGPKTDLDHQPLNGRGIAQAVFHGIFD